jgi:hypothetical protein
MSASTAEVYGKSKAFVDALRRLPRPQLAVAPRGHYARDYNNLRKLALEVLLDLDERLLGKYLAVYQGPKGEELADASYVEIETYAREIMEQLTLRVPLVLRNQAGLPAQAGKPWKPEEDQRLIQEFDPERQYRSCR